MRVLVNMLSTTNHSGRHVMMGHLRRLATWTKSEHEYVILYHEQNQHICCDLGDHVQWVACPARTAGWLARTWWERRHLNALAKQHGIDFIWTPSGSITPSLSVPQISYAMNPWALVPELNHKGLEALKAAGQRYGYKKAVSGSAMMLYLSEFMRQAYRKNAGEAGGASEVVYTGLDDELFARAESMRGVKKNRWQILSVSVMARHKGVETLLAALAKLLHEGQLPVELLLVGAWPDTTYEHDMRTLTSRLGITEAVIFKGHASTDELHRYYAEARVFCLMSWCESFGIPAVEAQAFGTPVVSSNCCAIPEVCGDGGVFPDPGDVNATVEALAGLLTDEVRWQTLSEAARVNAGRFRWELCTRPLLKMFDVVEEGKNG
jgi:glycosyltransferase involved in cell wall biosynthesis